MTSQQQIIADLRARLQAAEDALTRSDLLLVASRFAGAIMHEVNNPLEALTNLVYLTKQSSADQEKVLINMAIAEGELLRMGEITRKTLTFYREQKEAKTFDLIEIAESALKIHAQRLQIGGVEVKRRIMLQLQRRSIRVRYCRFSLT